MRTILILLSSVRTEGEDLDDHDDYDADEDEDQDENCVSFTMQGDGLFAISSGVPHPRETKATSTSSTSTMPREHLPLLRLPFSKSRGVASLVDVRPGPAGSVRTTIDGMHQDRVRTGATPNGVVSSWRLHRIISHILSSTTTAKPGRRQPEAPSGPTPSREDGESDYSAYVYQSRNYTRHSHLHVQKSRDQTP